MSRVLLLVALVALLCVSFTSASSFELSAEVEGDFFADNEIEWVQPVLLEEGEELQIMGEVEDDAEGEDENEAEAEDEAEAEIDAEADAEAEAEAEAETESESESESEKPGVAAGAAAPAAAAPAAAAPAAPAAARVAPESTIGGKKFLSLVGGKTNDQIWAPTVSERVKSAVLEFNARKPVGPNNKVYGESVRRLNLKGKTPAQVEAALKPYNCKKEMQVLKQAPPNQNLPVVDAQGKQVPMIVFLCEDGGAIRLKPNGDPTSKFRPQPHGVKALRYPYNSAFATFDDEVIKVDSFGNPMPKWGKDMAVFFPNDNAQQMNAADAWANRAHTDLAVPGAAPKAAAKKSFKAVAGARKAVGAFKKIAAKKNKKF